MSTKNSLETKYNVYPPKPNQNQQAIINKLRTLFKDQLRSTDDDAFIARFCRARQYDFEETKKMMVNYLKWRQDQKPDQMVLTLDMKHFLGYKTVQILPKPDKFGRPILYFQPHLHNPKNYNLEAATGAFYWLINQSVARMEPPIENYVVLVNLQKFQLRHNDMALLKQQNIYLQNFFPERLGVAILCYPPWYIAGIWKMMKSWFDDRMRQKVMFLEKEIPETLAELIDTDAIPVELGGQLRLPPAEYNMFDSSSDSACHQRDSEIERELGKIEAQV